jgi:hypothetical protein
MKKPGIPGFFMRARYVLPIWCGLWPEMHACFVAAYPGLLGMLFQRLSGGEVDDHSIH